MGNGKAEQVRGVVVVSSYVPEALLRKMDAIAKQFEEYSQIKSMKNPIKGGAYLFVGVVTLLISYLVRHGLGFMWPGGLPCLFNGWLKGLKPLPKAI
jgi:hypothetical protein